MDPEDLELLISEFSNSREHWVEVGLQSTYRSGDLEIRNIERQFNLFLNITTISVAFFAIAAPLIRGSLSLNLILATCFFFLTATIGVVILIVTIQRDKRLIAEDNIWEHQTLNEYLDQSVAIYSKLYDYKKKPNEVLWNDITSSVQNYFAMKEKTDGEAQARKIARGKEHSAIILKKLKILFWTFICLASIFLLVWLGT